jgi:hypothetical protein
VHQIFGRERGIRPQNVGLAYPKLPGPDHRPYGDPRPQEARLPSTHARCLHDARNSSRKNQQQVLALGFTEPWQCFADSGQCAHNKLQIARAPLVFQPPFHLKQPKAKFAGGQSKVQEYVAVFRIIDGAVICSRGGSEIVDGVVLPSGIGERPKLMVR